MGCLEASAALHSFKNSMKYEFVYYTINPFLVALITAQKMKFSIIDFFSKCDKIDLVTFTEEILSCSEMS